MTKTHHDPQALAEQVAATMWARDRAILALNMQLVSIKPGCAVIAMPVTAFAHSPKDTKDLIALAGGAPVVLKLLSSTQGKGVVLAETRKAAERLVDAFRGVEANFLVQEFVEEAGGADIRVFVIGNKVAGAMRRQAAKGEFRSNLHRGATASAARLTSTTSLQKRMRMATIHVI